MIKNKNCRQYEVSVVFDENGPSFDELLHYPEVIALFENILITRNMLKPEFRDKQQPADNFREESFCDIIHRKHDCNRRRLS